MKPGFEGWRRKREGKGRIGQSEGLAASYSRTKGKGLGRSPPGGGQSPGSALGAEQSPAGWTHSHGALMVQLLLAQSHLSYAFMLLIEWQVAGWSRRTGHCSGHQNLC